MGTPEFACPSLEMLLARRGDRVVGVVCQPDRPRGRGLTVEPPPVKRLALAHGLPVLQPHTLREESTLETLRGWAPDVVVVAAYGRILPPSVLEIPAHGCLNVHASLLPRHRGAAPVAWAILEGDTITGVTIMVMNDQLDAGDMLVVRETPIAPDDTTGSLTARLATLGAEALGEALDLLQSGKAVPIPQPRVGVTVAPKLDRDAGRLDWHQSALQLDRRIRAVTPEPGAFTFVRGKLLKVHRAAPCSGEPVTAPPGSILRVDRDGIVVATGAGALRLLEIQLEGRRRMPAAAFAAGARLGAGQRLGDPT